MEWNDWINVIGFGLAIIAFVSGLFHTRDINAATERVRMVHESISTRYLGAFPSFVKDIVALMESAEFEIIIHCDFPGYATLSDPAGALAYRYALEKQRERGVKISLTCFNKEARMRYLKEQYKAEAWDKWTKDAARRPLLDRFIRAYGDVPAANEVTIEQFFAANETADQQLLRQVFDGQARETSMAMPIYFWIADGKTAIFAIPTLGEVIEYGFKTSDLKFIEALIELRDRYRSAESITPVTNKLSAGSDPKMAATVPAPTAPTAASSTVTADGTGPAANA